MKRLLLITLWVMAAATVASAQSVFYFPQIANGQQGGGIVWTTGIAITNSGQPGADTATGTITFQQNDSSAFNIAFLDEQGKSASAGNSIFFNIAPGQTHFYTSTGAGALNTGFAKLTASALVTGTAVFTEKQGNTTIAQAAVFSSTPLPKQATFVVEDDFNDTAVAIANPGSSLANISFQLLDPNGTTVAAVNNFTLPSQNHVALFVSALFPPAQFPLYQRPFHGTMQISSPAQALVTTSLLFTGGGQFFTFPTITFASLIGSPLEWLENRLWKSLRGEFAI